VLRTPLCEQQLLSQQQGLRDERLAIIGMLRAAN
jgi:hypothetical protein